jgi:glycosyltransferase involved in cell wall biosynthesis
MTAVQPLPRGISVVIPVFRSGIGLETLYQALSQVMAEVGEPWELIFVEDWGEDGSWQIIEQLVVRDSHVRGVQLMRNYGQHNALLAGVCQASYDRVVTMDDDMQHPPKEVPRLIAALSDSVDLVYSVPKTTGHGVCRDLTSRLSKWILRQVTGFRSLEEIGSFRCFRTQLRAGFSQFQSPNVSLDVLLSWSTQRITSIRTEHQPRKYGKSNYNFIRLLRHMLNILTGFSTLPLRFAILCGFAMTAIGLILFGCLLLRNWIQGSAVQGFTYLASIIILFSGVQTFCIGIIGEYLARVFNSSIGKPYYVIRNTIGTPPSS